MSLHFGITFGNVGSEQFYMNENQEKLDTQFKHKLKDELDEDFSIVESYSSKHPTPSVVFRADFDKTDKELYLKYGSSGLSEQVAEIAETVYGCTHTKAVMEKWHN